ncbi:MAG: hypothetical protein LBL00_02565 [Endomicrobium sp.]|jgi:hypothetical protein|nr:hypothetical protein [Endomicrobium sp.]
MSNTHNKIIIFALALIFTAVQFAYGANGRRKNFLSHGPSVAAFSAGETVFSAYRDAAVIQYNPALIAFFQENVVNFTRFNLYEGSGYNSGSLVLNYLKFFQAGLSVSNLSTGSLEIREDIFASGLKTSVNNWNYVLSGAGMINALGLAYGLNMKYVYYDYYEKSGGFFAADLGLAKLFSGPELFGGASKIKLGLSAQNVVSGKLKLDIEDDDIVPIYRFSTAFLIPAYYRFQSQDTVSIYADLKYEDEFLDFYGGLAYTLADKYSVRAGYYPEHFTFGFGIDFYFFTIDYAADFGALDMVHRFGLSYRWGLKKYAEKTGAEEELDREAKEALNKEKLSLKEAEKKFNEAKKLYNKGEYLRSTDMLSVIVISYPNFESPMYFYTKMRDDMNKTAEADEQELNFAKRTYAKGYCAYYGAKYNEALAQWNKYVHFTGGSEEVFEYMEKINSAIKQQELIKREAELDAKAGKMLKTGIEKYKASKWVLCIKDMETLQKFVTDNKFSKTLEYYNKAKEYITKSVNELAKSIKTEKSEKPKIPETAAEEEKYEIDEASADKKYNEGLILYAQGHYFEAERTWELTLRLNPKHQKAKIALTKLRNSGFLSE